MFDPEKWAEQADMRLKQRANSANQQQEAFTERRKLLREEAPALWSKLRDVFQQLCDSYNKRRNIFVLSDMGPESFIVRRTDNTFTLTVLREAGHKVLVSSNVHHYSEKYNVGVLESGAGSVTYVTSDGAPITPEDIGTAAMTRVLGLLSA